MLEKYRFGSGKFSVNFNVLNISGSDSKEFLQKQSTFNFALLSDKEFHLVSFLDPQGRLDFYSWICKDTHVYKILVPLNLKDKATTRLEKFLISEDVIIEDAGNQSWFVTLGPTSHKHQSEKTYAGIFFDEQALFSYADLDSGIEGLSDEEIESWRCLNGWPELNGKNFKHEIINNTRLFELSVSPQKGCYPGQETVSKIAVNRGAAYAPVLLQTPTPIEKGEFFVLGKKIGDVESCFKVENFYLSQAKILRDFRVANLSLQIEQNQTSCTAQVIYYPFYPGDKELKSTELFYLGADSFKNNQLLIYLVVLRLIMLCH